MQRTKRNKHSESRLGRRQQGKGSSRRIFVKGIKTVSKKHEGLQSCGKDFSKMVDYEKGCVGKGEVITKRHLMKEQENGSKSLKRTENLWSVEGNIAEEAMVMGRDTYVSRPLSIHYLCPFVVLGIIGFYCIQICVSIIATDCI